MKKIYLLFALMLMCHSNLSYAKDTKPVIEDSVVEDDEAPEEEADDAKEADDADDAQEAGDDAEEADDDAEEADDADKPEALPAASKTPIVGKVGKTMAVEIDAKESQDFNLDLPKGEFFVYLDAQGLGEDSRTDATLYLLKRNGAEMAQYGGYLIYYNTAERTSRVGKAFSFSKPTGVRFRVKNESGSANNFWLTVVPAQPANFLPFSFGSPVKAAKIGPNNGTGGPLDPGEFEYLRAVIPAGTWSISLGAKTKEGSCYAWMDSFNARGVDYPDSISIFGVGKDERKEKIITLTKPTTLIFRVTNGAGGNPFTYDVTIEPSTD